MDIDGYLGSLGLLSMAGLGLGPGWMASPGPGPGWMAGPGPGWLARRAHSYFKWSYWADFLFQKNEHAPGPGLDGPPNQVWRPFTGRFSGV